MAFELPPGVEPNYVDPPSLGWKVTESTAITLAFAILSVVARLVTKFLVAHTPGWDDCIRSQRTAGLRC